MPSGASTGEFEATELRDGGTEWGGKGVGKAVGERQRRDRRGRPRPRRDATRRALDRALIELDGTPNKARLGANAILAVSLAAAHASAAEERLPLWRYLGGEAAHVLPVPMMNVLNGGAHADNAIDFQEFMIVPAGAPSLLRVPAHRAPRSSTRSRSTLHERRARDGRRRRGRLRARPRLQRGGAQGPRARASRPRATRPASDVAIALDPATSEIYGDGGYVLEHEGRTLRPDELAAYWADACDRYPIVSIEDGMDEEDWDGWQALTERLGDNVQLVGDDLFVTNPERLQRGIDAGRGQLDPHQGQPDRHADRDARRRSSSPARPATRAVMSHRSGETEDVTIADLAVATGCGQIKTGAPSRTDRVAKYNQLLRIEEALGEDASFPGRSILRDA